MTKTNNILGYLPTYLKKDSTSNNYKFVTSFNDDFQDVSNQSVNLKRAIQLSTAEGSELDSIGALFLLNRRTDEVDSDYRARIKAFWPGYSGGGTIESIKQAINRMAGVDPDDVIITNYAPRSALTSTIDNSVTTIPVGDTSLFRSTNGTIMIGDEIITYTGKTATTFTGCTRGALNSIAAAHQENINAFDYFGSPLKFKVAATVSGFGATIVTIQDVLENSKAAGTYIVFDLNAELRETYNEYSDTVNITAGGVYWIPDWRVPDSSAVPL